MGRLSRLVVAPVVLAWGLAVSAAPPGGAQEPPDAPAETGPPADEPADASGPADAAPAADAPPSEDPPAEPSLTVTPSWGLRDGDLVQVELIGFAGSFVAVTQCPASVVEDGVQLLDPMSCATPSDTRFQEVTTSPELLLGGWRVREWASGPTGTAHCAVPGPASFSPSAPAPT